MLNRRCSNSSLIRPRTFAAGRIDHKLHTGVVEVIEQVWAAFGDFLHAVQAENRVFRSLLVRHSCTIAGKCDDVRHAGFCRERNIFAKAFLNPGVVLDAIQRAADFAAARVAHAANQAVARWNLEILRM